MNMNKNIKILDTTLRDGSYAVNYSFTSHDTQQICERLQGAGIEFIEIGHGVGMNGSANHGKAVQTDEEYLAAAAEVLSTSKFGMFCIPGIARLEDLDLAAKYNMDFIRIGTNLKDVEDAKPFIEKAKAHGMFVASNFMKSYVLEPKLFAEKVQIAESYGADLVYVVDSAGGMFPHQVAEYYKAVREVTSIPLGFHGHNNLMLGNANSLEAVRVGYDFVDTSLQGLGRSSGNACTEILVCTLEKMGIATGLDYHELLDTAFDLITPLVNSNGRHPIDVISGHADFHSSYMGLIRKYASKYSVDPIRLIEEVSKVNRVDVIEEDVDRVAKDLEKEDDLYIGKYRFNRYIGNEQQR